MHALAAIRDLARYRALLLHLAGVQFRTRYHNAILGVGWTLATPLALFVVFTTIFKPIFDINEPNYGIWLLTALFPWTFLSASVSETIRTLQANATFIKADTFPREVLPLAGVLVQLLSLGLALIMVVAFAVATLGATWQLALLPIPIALLTCFTAGMCLLLSSLDAVYKDVRYLVDVSMLGWFFLTPIFYPLEKIVTKADLGPMQFVVLYNPVTPLVEAFRACILPGKVFPDLTFVAILSVALLLFGLAQFRRLVDKYVDLL